MITVVGSTDGHVVTRFVLEHGEDPAVGLAVRGWPGTVVAVEGVLGDLTLRYTVQPAAPVDPPLGPEGPGSRMPSGSASTRTSGSPPTPSSWPRAGCC